MYLKYDFGKQRLYGETNHVYNYSYVAYKVVFLFMWAVFGFTQQRRATATRSSGSATYGIAS
jgi:hypothetical protein